MDPADDASPSAPAAELEVEVVWCAGRGHCDLSRLRVPAGATVADAVRLSGVLARMPPTPVPDTGIHGRRVDPRRRLAAGDRIELYRPLHAAPGDARRERHRQAVREAARAAAQARADRRRQAGG